MPIAFSEKRRIVMDHILSYLTPAVIAAIVAAVMSISLPWVNWGIEKRRLQRQRRIDYIDAVRRFALENSPDLSELVQTPEYAAIRKHLPSEFVSKIEQADGKLTINVVIGSGRSSGANNFRPQLFDELSKLEARWKLV